MDEPIKKNEHILSNREAFLAAYKRAEVYFNQLQGVVGIGIGQKETNSAYKDQISIVVYVEEKKSEAELPPAQRIPKSFEGYPTDVTVVKSFRPGACENTANYDTIQGGIQIAPAVNNNRVSQGTLGCIVRKRGDSGRENVHLLSNKHVLYADGSRAGDYIYHPNPPTPPNVVNLGETHTLGPVSSNAFYQNVNYTPPGATVAGSFFIDCATARIDIDSKCLGSTCTSDVIHTAESIIDLQLNGVNTISDVRSIINDPAMVGQQVFKVGRTTGKTTGIVRHVSAPAQMPSNFDNLASPLMLLSNVIIIDFDVASTGNGLNCKGNAFFGEHGDSGSLIVDGQNRALALLFGVPPAGATGVSPNTASHILPILDNLGMCIPVTTGTSHGSSRATDGSGLVPLSSSGGGASGRNIGYINVKERMPREGVFLAEPLSEQNREHLSSLLQEFRSTQKGRELHAAFGHVRREIGYLVRNCRPVTVAWQRNKGPAFFASLLNHLRGDLAVIPHEINGVRLSALLDKMEAALLEHGSRPLCTTVQRYAADVRAMLLHGNDVREFIAHLQNRVSA